MQDRKEELTEFVKTIKKKVPDWWMSYPRKLWTTCIFVYGGLLLLVIFVGAVTFAHFNLFHTDVNSARYMLSALVQSQAAIVAIVITLTLIAVQLTASAYSPRVIDIFKKNPDMWILLGCYGVSIFYGFIVLKLVEGAEGEFVSQSAIWALGSLSISFESCVSLAYWLGAFTFVALFPYMWNIINLLKSGNIIKRLANEITREDILKEKNPLKDPLQPIVDIIHGSIMKYDLETTRVGLKAVTGRMIEVIGSVIPERFCHPLYRVGRLAASREDEESTVEVMANLLKFGEVAAEKQCERETSVAVEYLGKVGAIAAEKELERATSLAVYYLETFEIIFSPEKVTVQVAMALRKIGIIAAKKGLEDAAQKAAKNLVKIGATTVEEEHELAEIVALYLLELRALSEKIIKIAFPYARGDLDKQYLDSFQKFMKLYEQLAQKSENREKTSNKKTESR